MYYLVNPYQPGGGKKLGGFDVDISSMLNKKEGTSIRRRVGDIYRHLDFISFLEDQSSALVDRDMKSMRKMIYRSEGVVVCTTTPI